MTKVHNNNDPPTLFECDKCNKTFTNRNELKSHTDKTHVSRMKFKNTLLVADSHSKYQNPRLIERESLGGQGLFAPSFMHPRVGRAYCSSPDWPNSYYLENNLKDKIPELLRSREHSLLIFGAPGNNISNIGSIEGQIVSIWYIKLLEFAYKSSSVSQLQNWAVCKPSFEPKSVNSPKK